MSKAPVFQHRHYKAIASLIAANVQGKADQDAVAKAFVGMFQADNSRFDRARFLAAANGRPVNGRDTVKS